VRGLGVAAVVGLTCLGGYLWGARRLSLSCTGLRAAAAATLEAIGLGVLFLAVNLALVVLPFLAVRAMTSTFVSFHDVDQVTIATVSLLQGFVGRWWWDRG
jgi:hypothetical protein